jgi:hypothetical protein
MNSSFHVESGERNGKLTYRVHALEATTHLADLGRRRPRQSGRSNYRMSRTHSHCVWGRPTRPHRYNHHVA